MTDATEYAESLVVADTDEDVVRLAAQRLQEQSDIAAAIEQIRDAAAIRLRERGVPMTRIAVWARVSDSYLARRLFRQGATRKVLRA